MNQMRYDWLSDRWVIFAPNRLSRPDDFATPQPPSTAAPKGPCPFCRGYETQTPSPTLVLHARGVDPTSEDWLVRVVPNKFPAVSHSEFELGNRPRRTPQRTFFSSGTRRELMKFSSSRRITSAASRNFRLTTWQ
jgi:galactose-1-phosphate uridylyltransferase